MKTFLQSVVDDLNSKNFNLSKCHYVVPSRRVATFLNKEIAKASQNPVFEPNIYSVEDFISHVAQVEIATDIDLVFDFYSSYCAIEGADSRDSLDEFITWAPTILKDFNEVDRFLIEPKDFFNFLGNLKELEKGHWSILEPKTEMVQRYLHFWKKLDDYYEQFTNDCIKKGVVYQGLAYRLAFNNSIKQSEKYSTEEPIIFLGLNALNKSEEEIIKVYLENNVGKVYWDCDTYFQENKFHEAGRFLRKYKDEWTYYDKNPFEIRSHEYINKKEINLIGTSGALGIGQAAGKIIQDLLDKEHSLDNTALVLADEALLLPVLSAIPELVSHLNITMGLTLDQTPLASFFNHCILLKIHQRENGYYYKDVIHILESHFATLIDPLGSRALLQEIHKENMVFLPENFKLKETKSIFLTQLFKTSKNAVQLIEFVNNIAHLLKAILIADSSRRLELEQLLGINGVIEQLTTITQIQNDVTDIKTIHFLFKQLLPQKKLDFIGEPVKGLQVMGLLETRALDYENIIMLSVNEGVLPAGKSTSSYIPYDMKVKFGLPTYTDKDSVYAYHFYRLLQRCKTAHLIYNSEPNSLGGGEKSRFLMQLETSNIESHKINHILYANKVKTSIQPVLEISKDDFYFKRLYQIAQSGFSPSSITSYIYDPIDFYRKKILRVNDLEEVEEDMAANTMGTMIHKTLETLYVPYKNQVLALKHIKSMKENMEHSIHKSYIESYKTNHKPQGKNIIMYEVARHYVLKMLAHDEELIKKGHNLIIKQLEIKYESIIEVESIGKVKIHGEVDRIDTLDGELRIIDYKSGKVGKNNVAVQQDDYSELIESYEKSKAFQVLMYAYLFSRNNDFTECTPGIISFKNFKEGFIPYRLKDNRKYIDTKVDHEELKKFEEQLHNILKELYNKDIPLIENER